MHIFVGILFKIDVAHWQFTIDRPCWDCCISWLSWTNPHCQVVLLMEEILQQLLGSLYHFKGFYTSQVVIARFLPSTACQFPGNLNEHKWTQMRRFSDLQPSWSTLVMFFISRFFFGICFKDESCFGFTSKRVGKFFRHHCIVCLNVLEGRLWPKVKPL